MEGTDQSIVQTKQFMGILVSRDLSQHKLREQRIGVGHWFDVGMWNRLVGGVARSQFVQTTLIRIRIEGDECSLVALE